MIVHGNITQGSPSRDPIVVAELISNLICCPTESTIRFMLRPWVPWGLFFGRYKRKPISGRNPWRATLAQGIPKTSLPENFSDLLYSLRHFLTPPPSLLFPSTSIETALRCEDPPCLFLHFLFILLKLFLNKTFACLIPSQVWLQHNVL